MNLAVKWVGVAIVMYSVPVAVGKTIEWAQGITQPLPPIASVSAELKPRSRGRLEELEERVAKLEAIVTEEAMRRDALDRMSAEADKQIQDAQGEFNRAIVRAMQEAPPQVVVPPAPVDINVTQSMIQQPPVLPWPGLNNPLLMYPYLYR